jgi:DNA-directed RNA polymerase omega subunit
MILQSTDELEEYVGNKYSLVILAAKRARQLKEGHIPLARDASDNKLSQALREIAEHKLEPVAPPEEEIAPAPRDVITSLVTGADFDLDEDLDLEGGDAVDDLAALLVGADEDEAEDEQDEDDGADATTVQTADADDDEEDSEDEDDEEDSEGGEDDSVDTDEEADSDEE